VFLIKFQGKQTFHLESFFHFFRRGILEVAAEGVLHHPHHMVDMSLLQRVSIPIIKNSFFMLEILQK
jgi:hypothetical protein